MSPLPLPVAAVASEKSLLGEKVVTWTLSKQAEQGACAENRPLAPRRLSSSRTSEVWI